MVNLVKNKTKQKQTISNVLICCIILIMPFLHSTQYFGKDKANKQKQTNTKPKNKQTNKQKQTTSSATFIFP